MGIGNTFFNFKQFSIEQGKCAQKVSTDACILGAWTPVYPTVSTILDIGTGTGLLALMLAGKKADTYIHAIDIDNSAVIQARENVQNSPWANRIVVFEGDIIKYQLPHAYDLIICNPPFFNNSLLSNQLSKNLARHTIALKYEDLLKCLDTWLNRDGYAAMLLPLQEFELFKVIAERQGWGMINILYIQHNIESRVHRVVFVLERNPSLPAVEEHLLIKDGSDNYTKEFGNYLSPYYLYL